MAIAKTVQEQRESDNRHTIINDEQTTAIVLPRGKIQYLKLSDRQETIAAVADELQITTAGALEIFVDRLAHKRPKTEPETAVVDALLSKIGARCAISDTEADALVSFQKKSVINVSWSTSQEDHDLALLLTGEIYYT